MTTRQQLMEEREKLKRKLSEVEKQISNFDAEVYGGKMKKAIICLALTIRNTSHLWSWQKVMKHANAIRWLIPAVGQSKTCNL